MENTNEVEDTQEANQAGTEIKDPKAVLEALERAKTDAKTNREKLDAEIAKTAELQSKYDALASDEGIGKLKRRIVELQVQSALAAEGIKDGDRVAKYLALDTYDLDDEGNLTGFTENLSQVKNDLPELFDLKRRAGGKADLFADGEAKEDAFRAAAKNAAVRR